jgi:hypothetical protein
MCKKVGTYLYKGIVFSSKNEWSTDIMLNEKANT